jgi:PAS domain S-box-containing protein
MIDLEVFRTAVSESRDGIAISDPRLPDNPLVYVNPGFERLTGYGSEEAVGENCRYLQGPERDQPGIEAIRTALRLREHCLVVLKNFRRDGSMFYNELSISPVHDNAGRLAFLVGIQKDVTGRVLFEKAIQEKQATLEASLKELEQMAYRDALTGVFNRRYFDTQLKLQWNIAGRTQTPLSLFMVDIDFFKQFNDRYGH